MLWGFLRVVFMTVVSLISGFFYDWVGPQLRRLAA